VGELSRRTGVGISTLRAWESRFGLLQPTRSASGQRLYAESDVERVAAVTRLVAEGLTLSAAVGRIATAGPWALTAGESDALLLHQVMQSLHQGIWVCQGGRTRYANTRMAQLMRCPIDDLVASAMIDFVDAEDVECVREHAHLVRQGHRRRYEARLRRPDGTLLHAHVVASPLWDVLGAYKGAVAVINAAYQDGD
jgi:PAS domain S-box-containing protein